MTCLTYLLYLEQRIDAENEDDKDSIETSIEMLNIHIRNWRFVDDVVESFAFGSFMRNTNLPTCIDEDTDVDYMIVFDTTRLKPDSYLVRLRNFATEFYPRTRRYQDHPTIVLDMNKIKFEISPATQLWGRVSQYYQIPAPHQSYLQWINTYPQQLEKDLNDADHRNHYKIRPVIRLLKYWNVLNGKRISSYKIEEYVITHVFFNCHNLKEYFFEAAKWMHMINVTAPTARRKIQKLRTDIEEIEELERQGHRSAAEERLEELLPDF